MADFPYTQNQLDWLEALKSGKYQQTRGSLYDSDNDIPSYCCLGVHCQISNYELDGFNFINEGWSSRSELHGKLNKLGLRNSIGEFSSWYTNNSENFGPCHANSLVSANDNFWTFKQIADWVESCPQGFFNNLD